MCLTGAVDPDRFKGKLVLIGTSAVGLLDLKTTPIDPAMPGVEVHAQLLESMLASDASLTSPSYATLAELAIAMLVGLAIIALAPVLGAWALFWVGGAMAALLVGLSGTTSAQRNLLIDFTFPLIASFADLSHPRLHQLSARPLGAAPDPLRLRAVSLAGARRAARPIAREARARR